MFGHFNDWILNPSPYLFPALFLMLAVRWMLDSRYRWKP
jgi:hypothetical protein